MDQYKWLWGAIFVFVGFFLGLFGKKLFSVTLFIIGMLVTIALVFVLFYTTFLTNNTKAWVGWTVLGCAIILGIFGGILLFKCQRLGAAVLGGWGGFVLGLLLNETVLFAAKSDWLFWITTISACLVGAGLSFCCYNPVIIMATSFSGSYLFVRGISLYAGGYPNEFTLVNSLETGAATGITGWFYLYLAFIILFTIICACVQFKQHKKDEMAKEAEKQLSDLGYSTAPLNSGDVATVVYMPANTLN